MGPQTQKTEPAELKVKINIHDNWKASIGSLQLQVQLILLQKHYIESHLRLH